MGIFACKFHTLKTNFKRMKDIIISSKQQKKELCILCCCFAFSFLLNIIAIIIYRTNWSEAFTQLGYVFMITIVLYLLIVFIRIFIYLIKKIFNLT